MSADEERPDSERPQRRPPRSRDDNDDDRRRERVGDDERRPRRRHDDDDRPSREPEFEATDLIIPTNVSGYSIAACYLGLVSCFLPVIGLLFALIALLCGIVALRQRKKKSASYGAVTGDMRAVIGIVLSSLTLLAHLFVVVVAILGPALK